MVATPASSGAFSPTELMPRTGDPAPRDTPAKLTALRQRHSAIRSIFIQNANHVGVFKSLDEVIALGCKGRYQTGVRNASESYAGKSSSADEFARIICHRGTFAVEARPVVRVELEQACTPKRFWLAILAAYGDGFASSKDEEQLRRSAYDAFEKHGTVLLIIDEVQHSGYRSKGFSAPTDVIKRFISDAQVGIGLFGNEKAKELLESNNQLCHRLLPPCDIQPLNLADAGDQKLFRKFVQKYDRALVDNALFDSSSDLTDERTLNCLMSVSRGYLGRVVTLIQVAARYAFLRDAPAIEFCDLSFACTTWAVGQKLAPYDPFRFGTVAGYV